MSSVPGWGRSPGGGHGNSLQYSYLENPMDRGAWRATVHGVTKRWTRLKQLSTAHVHTHMEGENFFGRKQKTLSQSWPAAFGFLLLLLWSYHKVADNCKKYFPGLCIGRIWPMGGTGRLEDRREKLEYFAPSFCASWDSPVVISHWCFTTVLTMFFRAKNQIQDHMFRWISSFFWSGTIPMFY